MSFTTFANPRLLSQTPHAWCVEHFLPAPTATSAGLNALASDPMGTECFTGGRAAQYSLPAVDIFSPDPNSEGSAVDGSGAPTRPVGLSARFRTGNLSSSASWWGPTLVSWLSAHGVRTRKHWQHPPP